MRYSSIFFGVVMGVKFRSFGAMVNGVRAVPCGDVRMMSRRFGLFFLIMFGGPAMMKRRLLMMLGGGMVMGAGRMLMRHGKRSFWLPLQAHPNRTKQTCQRLFIFAKP